MGYAINNSLEHIESNALNPCGHIPVVSTATGGLRVVLGAVEVIAGLAISILQGIVSAYYTRTGDDRKCDFSAGLGTMLHGFANLARGTVEMIPFVNMITMKYDKDPESGLYTNPHRLHYRTEK